MTTLLSQKIHQLQQDYTYLSVKHGESLKENAPNTVKLKKKVDRLSQELFHKESNRGSLVDWKNTQDSWFSKAVRFTKFGHSIFGLCKPKKSSDTPYVFHDSAESDLESARKWAKFWSTMNIVSIVAGAILIGSGIIAPFVLLPLLLSMPEATASMTLTALVAAGVFGTFISMGSLFFADTQSHRKYRVMSDKDFKYFIDTFVQNTNALDHNLSDSQILDKGLHKAYTNWKEQVGNLFKEYQDKQALEMRLK